MDLPPIAAPSKSELNDYEQPVGMPSSVRTECLPTAEALAGGYAEVVPLAQHHVASLFAHYDEPRAWTYLPYGPFANAAELEAQLLEIAARPDTLLFAVQDSDGAAQGVFALMNIQPRHATLELGHVHFSAALQRTAVATEAVFLILEYAFEHLHYRRVEWKCNALNAASKRAAERFGFAFEGLFRQHQIVKGRSRDTTWYSMLHTEWPARKAAYLRWLDPNNFDSFGVQRTSLSAMMAALAR